MFETDTSRRADRSRPTATLFATVLLATTASSCSLRVHFGRASMDHVTTAKSAPPENRRATPSTHCQIRADLDGDGVRESIFGMPRDGAKGPSTGRVDIVSSGRHGAIYRTWIGDSAGDRFGWSVAAVGDVNGDGHQDFVVGAPLNDANGNASGSAYLFSGKDGGRLHVFRGAKRGDQFGFAVGNAGDVDGDGSPDIAIGAPYADVGGRSSGSVFVYSGKSGRLIRVRHGRRSGERLGQKLRTSL